MPILSASVDSTSKLRIFGTKKRKGIGCPLSSFECVSASSSSHSSEEDSVGSGGGGGGGGGDGPVTRDSFSLECGETLFAGEEEEKEEEEQGGERESVFSWLSDDVLFLVLQYTSQEHWASASRVCRRWNAVGRVAFNEFKTAKSFMHALFFDPGRLTRMVDNPRLSAALARNDEVVETVCQKVTSPRLLQQWVKGLAYPRWMKCLIKALQHANQAAIVALFQAVPPSLSREQMCDEIVTRALALREAKTQSLMWLMEQIRVVCPSFFGSTYLVVSCCFAKQDELLCCLLKDYPHMFGPENLLYILNHAADQRNVTLLGRVFAAPFACRIIPGPETIYLAKKLCKLGWTNAANLLLPPTPTTASVTTAHPDVPLMPGAEGGDLTSMLRLAAIAGQTNTVRMLLDRQDVRPGMRHNVIIREAMEMGHKEVVLALLNDPRVSVFPVERAEVSVLCCAMRCGQGADVIEQLVARCPEGLLLDFANQFNHAPARLALKRENREALAKLFSLCNGMMMFSRDEVMSILALVGGMSEYSDMSSRIIHDKRFARYFDWNR